MVQALPYLIETASQTAGPYVHIGLAPAAAGLALRTQEKPNVLVGALTEGERIRIEGRVIDGAGAPLRDGLIELWQANAHGRYNHPADTQQKALDPEFRGFGRSVTDLESGLFWFETIKPGRVPGRRGQPPMAPHVSLWIVARGINIGLNTRMYFDDEAAANAEDPVLRLVEPAERRQTLIAARGQRGGEVVYRFDIHLQGAQETVFFDV
jgi:protocatechuate 3,4-dioxygenase alpha subunit